jgi:cytochrome c551/c552
MRLMIPALLPAALLLTGCDDTIFGGHGGGDVVPTGTDLCAVVEIFDSECLSCHAAAVKLGDLDLETDPHAALVDVASYYAGYTLVVPGDAEGSLLYQKVTGTQGSDAGDEMPPGSGLSSDLSDVIAAWINDGASSECSDGGGDTGSTGDDTGDGGDDGGGDNGGDTDTGPAAADWASAKQVLTDNCLGCHSAAAAPSFAGLDLETDPYNALVGVWSTQWKDQILVVAGVPEESLLYLKMTDTQGSYGSVMPTSGALDSATTDIIYNWIAAGATQD